MPVTVTVPVPDTGGPALSYVVEVEDGIDAAIVGGDDAFTAAVDHILHDPRGWTTARNVAFRRIDSGDPDFRISLTTPQTTREPGLCGYDIPYEGSCYNRIPGRVVINLARWIRGALAFDGNIGSYRHYIVNHEVGHTLGEGHEGCRRTGEPAPIMMQQTYGTANDYVFQLNQVDAYNKDAVPHDGQVCRPNPWPTL